MRAEGIIQIGTTLNGCAILLVATQLQMRWLEAQEQRKILGRMDNRPG